MRDELFDWHFNLNFTKTEWFFSVTFINVSGNAHGSNLIVVIVADPDLRPYYLLVIVDVPLITQPIGQRLCIGMVDSNGAGPIVILRVPLEYFHGLPRLNS
ncbi:hypothetical protein BO443_110066 [Burkholderia orbicola]